MNVLVGAYLVRGKWKGLSTRQIYDKSCWQETLVKAFTEGSSLFRLFYGPCCITLLLAQTKEADWHDSNSSKCNCL